MRLPAVALVLLAVTVPMANVAAQETVPDDAVLNGGFEIAAHAARPAVCAAFGDGSTPVFDPANPFGLPWLLSVSPCHTGAVKAIGWSSGVTVDVQDFDGDGDREARFLAGSSDPELGSHNLWQAYPNPHQAYVADFTALTLRVESGSVPPGAFIQMALSASPLAAPHPFVGVYYDCLLTFRPGTLVPDGSGLIALDPVAAVLTSAYVACNEAAAAFQSSADPAVRRAALAGLRIVQHSYWRWNSGAGDVTIDDVALVGARTAAEALLP